jgi:Amt family ammonium transporter
MKRILVLTILLFSAFPLFAQGTAPAINNGDTAWILISSALVMFMTIPALGFFYGGLVKRKNILNILMQCFISLAVLSIFWVTVGYSLAFSPKSMLGGFIGNLDWALLNNVGMEPSTVYATTVPHLAFMIFQGMFAVITPALIIGAFAERIKFSTFMVFTILWALLVYCPIAHWMWSADGWLYKKGAVDFAGGIVVHIAAGMAALATAIVIGKRTNLRATPPHNLAFTVLGAGMLWFGWFGFNAGSALSAGGLAASAFVMTNAAASTATVAWLILDWILAKKPTMLGAATGAIAGLAAVTPAAVYVNLPGALIIGLVSSLLCYVMVVLIKPKAHFDDALDAFGVHGIGGLWGSIAVGLFATPLVQPTVKGLVFGGGAFFKTQVFAVGVTAVFAFAATLLIFKILDLIMGARVNENEEAMGLDMTQHHERAYTVME